VSYDYRHRSWFIKSANNHLYDHAIDTNIVAHDVSAGNDGALWIINEYHVPQALQPGSRLISEANGQNNKDYSGS
jgi:hypothetical protein